MEALKAGSSNNNTSSSKSRQIGGVSHAGEQNSCCNCSGWAARRNQWWQCAKVQRLTWCWGTSLH